jgi:hypothetical protein
MAATALSNKAFLPPAQDCIAIVKNKAAGVENLFGV